MKGGLLFARSTGGFDDVPSRFLELVQMSTFRGLTSYSERYFSDSWTGARQHRPSSTEVEQSHVCKIERFTYHLMGISKQ